MCAQKAGRINHQPIDDEGALDLNILNTSGLAFGPATFSSIRVIWRVLCIHKLQKQPISDLFMYSKLSRLGTTTNSSSSSLPFFVFFSTLLFFIHGHPADYRGAGDNSPSAVCGSQRYTSTRGRYTQQHIAHTYHTLPRLQTSKSSSIIIHW